MGEVVVEARFRGPPQSGNGGYVGGLFSKTIDHSGQGNVEVVFPARSAGILGGISGAKRREN